MLIKYGKPMQMRKISRNLGTIRNMIDEDRKRSEECYKEPMEGDAPRCRICGGGYSDLFVSVWGKYHYYLCKTCGAVFLHNLPDIKKLYASDHTANGSFYIDESVYMQRVRLISEPKVRFVLEACEQAGCPVRQWLDIGCGGGEILTYLKNTKIEAVGIESDPDEVRFASEHGLRVYHYYIDLTKEEKEINDLISTSDIISCINVIEHVEEPVRFVKYICDRMKAGSVFVFEVPRHPSLASFANQTCPNAVYRHIVPPIHLQVFSEKSLIYLLGEQLEIIGKWEFGQGYTDLINNAMILGGLEESELYVSLMNISNRIQPVIDEAGYADQMLVVARKKKCSDELSGSSRKI